MVALWVPATTRVVSDAPHLRAYIDEYLDAYIQTELEDQIVTGDGLGENFTGHMNVSGTQTLAAPVAAGSNLDALRQPITLLRVNARSEPSAIVLNPTDAQNIDLLKSNNEANTSWGRVRTAWGPPGSGTSRWSRRTRSPRERLSSVTSPRRCCSTGCRREQARHDQRPIHPQHGHRAWGDQGRLRCAAACCLRKGDARLVVRLGASRDAGRCSLIPRSGAPTAIA